MKEHPQDQPSSVASYEKPLERVKLLWADQARKLEGPGLGTALGRSRSEALATITGIR